MVIGISFGTPSLLIIRSMSFGLLSSAASRWVIFFSTEVVFQLVAAPLVSDERPLTIVFFIVQGSKESGYTLPLLSPWCLVPVCSKHFHGFFFFHWPFFSAKRARLARQLTKSILYGIWTFRNRATFRNGKEDRRTIIRYVSCDLRKRVFLNYKSFFEYRFRDVWVMDGFCAMLNGFPCIVIEKRIWVMNSICPCAVSGVHNPGISAGDLLCSLSLLLGPQALVASCLLRLLVSSDLFVLFNL